MQVDDQKSMMDDSEVAQLLSSDSYSYHNGARVNWHKKFHALAQRLARADFLLRESAATVEPFRLKAEVGQYLKESQGQTAG